MTATDTALPVEIDDAELERRLKTRAEDDMYLFRVKAEAATMPVPTTPDPLPLAWWQQFDTD